MEGWWVLGSVPGECNIPRHWRGIAHFAQRHTAFSCRTTLNILSEKSGMKLSTFEYLVVPYTNTI